MEVEQGLRSFWEESSSGEDEVFVREENQKSRGFNQGWDGIGD